MPLRRDASSRMAASVNSSQPRFWCEPACEARTVNVALSSNTPWSLQRVRSPSCGIGVPRSLCISLNMLSSDGGKGIPLFTEKQRPLACPAPWYGSCPSMTTFTLSNGQWSKALNISLAGGYIGVPLLYSSFTNCVSLAKYSLLN